MTIRRHDDKGHPMTQSEASERTDAFVPHAFEERTVDLGEIRMNYVAEGDPDAPPLLLVPAQSESWWGYEKALPLLTDRFRVYAVDLRGQGRSTWTPGRYTLDNLGNDLVRFLDLVVRRPAYVAGNSSGGLISAWLAARAKPGQVRAAVLEDPPVFSAEVAPPVGPAIHQSIGPLFAARSKWLGDQWSIGDWEGLTRALRNELPDALGRFVAALGGDDGGLAAKEVPQHLREYDPEWGRSFVSGLANAACDHADLLSQVRVPVLFTHHFRTTDPETGHLIGACTDVQARHACRLMEAAGQPVTYADLPDAAHGLHDADPELYVRTVVEWIDSLT
ncbi:alpha/beta hydrolase [Streptomyces sp. NPDC001941]|uniref:alpha/beta fold hydrolase n=1 Tax=Streptomyces sp. NPDC001941 TaxID=3154659 RepID=UPI00332599C4